MGCVEHAKKEFLHAGYKPIEEEEDGPNKWIQENVLELLEVFAKQGHSGSSANYAVSCFSKLALQKPLTSIKCTDDEWNDVSKATDGREMFQNNRLSSVFKEGNDGKPYYLDAIVWQGEDDYDAFTGSVEKVCSRQYIKLPFTPKTFYIDVTRELYDKEKHKGREDEVVSCGNGDYVYSIKDREQLKEVFEYYEEFKYIPRPKPTKEEEEMQKFCDEQSKQATDDTPDVSCCCEGGECTQC